MKVKLEEVERYERHVKMRLAFRFGVITVTDATQAVIRVRVSLPDGRTSHGVAAEALAAKWFEKSPEFTDEQNLDQLRQSLDLAIELYRAQGFDTPSTCSPAPMPSSRSAARRWASIRWWRPTGRRCSTARSSMRWAGPPGNPSPQMIAQQSCRASATTSLTPDIADADLAPLPGRPEAGPSIEVRHTVGLVDPLTAADRPASERVNDGLPETLEEVVSYYRGRYYKLKVGGDIKADLERLSRIAAVLDRRRRRLPRHARRQRAVRRRRRHRRAVAQGRARRRRWRRLVEVDAVHRAADQARRGAVSARSSRWPGCGR